MTIFYTSDHHFYHRNILNFENRPFETVEEMNQGLIDMWNDQVKPNDIVHHLGDFCFGGYEKWKSILDQLNGNIILYKGNHDQSRALNRLLREGYFKELHMLGDYFKIRSPHTKNRYQLYLSHFPMDIGLRPRKYSISGHIHSIKSRLINQVNVGVDSPMNFNRTFGKLVTEEELITYLDYIEPIVEQEFLKERERWSKA